MNLVSSDRWFLPPAKDWASTSAVKAVLVQPAWRSSACRCSPPCRTFLQRPYRKLCRTSEVITSDSAARAWHLYPDLRAKASAGSTEPILSLSEPEKLTLKKKCRIEEDKVMLSAAESVLNEIWLWSALEGPFIVAGGVEGVGGLPLEP